MQQDFTKRTTPVATKQHTCTVCGGEIEIGEKHVFIRSVKSGKPSKQRIHTECDRRKMIYIGQPFGGKAENHAIEAFAEEEGKDVYTLMLEVSAHYEVGCHKYGDRNWEKGIPLHCYIDSGVRHYLKYLRGDMDEPHDRAFVWNLMCAIWTHHHIPEMIDLPFRVGGGA